MRISASHTCSLRLRQGLILILIHRWLIHNLASTYTSIFISTLCISEAATTRSYLELIHWIYRWLIHYHRIAQPGSSIHLA